MDAISQKNELMSYIDQLARNKIADADIMKWNNNCMRSATIEDTIDRIRREQESLNAN